MTSPPCPICKNPSRSDFFPFCSRICSYIDLGHWFSEKYQIPVDSGEEAEESAEEVEN